MRPASPRRLRAALTRPANSPLLFVLNTPRSWRRRLFVIAAVLSAFRATAADWRTEPGCRWAPLTVAPTGKVGFTRLNPAELGIDFTNALADDRVAQFQNLMNGAGLAALDFDGDGRPDLYFIHKQGPNQLYRNLGGWRFANVTAGSGAACTNLSSVGVVAGDLNGDGAPDLVVSSFGGPHALLLNDGHGRFTDATAAAGDAGNSGGTSMALADVDGDGDLDLYFCNFAVQALLRDGAAISTRVVDGKTRVTGRYARRLTLEQGRLVEWGDPDVLFLNDGVGHFTPAAWEQSFTDADGKPATPPPDFGLAVQIRDVNGDGFPDIYVCNDFQTPDRLWFGDGRGHFREASPWVQRNMSYASMGVDFADIDRDGRMDFVTVEMLNPDLGAHQRTLTSRPPAARPPGQFAVREEFPRNCLYRQRSDGTFDEVALFAGVAATGWSWTALFLDVDLDGWEDLLVSNGHLHDVNNRDVTAGGRAQAEGTIQATKDKLPLYPPLDPPKCAFRNRRDRTFEDVGAAWGFDARDIAHGMIAADLDGDGDLDVILNRLNGPPLIYRNDTDRPRVAVRLKGLKPNGSGIGAKITLRGGPVTQTQEMIAGGQYLSASEPLRVFAAGAGEMTLEVRWRSGRQSVINGVGANRLYEVDEAGADAAPPSTPPPPPRPEPLFAEAESFSHHHYEEPFDDFAQQPLLPRRLSQLGPCVVAADFNGDGRMDLALGSGRGGRPTVMWGDGKGGFRETQLGAEALTDDVLGLAALPHGAGGCTLLAVLANYESGKPEQPSVLRWDFADGKFQPGPPVPSIGASPSAIALGDVDGDGAADLFVGGRVIPRRWPEPAGSRLFRQQGGGFVVDERNSATLAAAGLVTCAVFADLAGDGRPALALSTEMGPVRIFRNQGGILVEWNPPITWMGRTAPLSAMTGLWSCLAAADLDGDGRTDLVVGNWGMNSSWQVWGDGLPAVAFGDFDGSGTDAVIEAVRVGGVLRPWRDRDHLARGLPGLAARFPRHADFSEASLDAVLGPLAPKARTLRVETLASIVLLNKAGGWEATPLPSEAQWAPVNAIVASDANGDGRPDLFLAQNCFSVRPEDERLDTGRGLWLANEGGGRFRPLSGEQSGVVVYGEQRGAAAADLNGDGRPDLVVTQNGAATRLFLGLGAPAGK